MPNDEARTPVTPQRVRELRELATDLEEYGFPDQIRMLRATADQLERNAEVQWQPIETAEGHGAVLISRAQDAYRYEPTTAFLDATGVWRVFRSKGGNTPLPFEPTHWQPLPKPPEAKC